jgi:hypothetical protein
MAPGKAPCYEETEAGWRWPRPQEANVMNNEYRDGGVLACQRCGLRVVRQELEARGISIRFCPECYWGELEDTGADSEGADKKDVQTPARPAV